jgi:hypothetical protein
MKLEIHLKRGIGELVFGLSIEDIIKIIGSPTEVEEMGEDIDYPTIVLHYEELGLNLFFDNNNSTKLTCIDLDNPNATLFGEKIIDLSPRKIEELMIKNNIFNETKEKEEWGEMRISFEDYSIDFYFIDEKLVSITFGK